MAETSLIILKVVVCVWSALKMTMGESVCPSICNHNSYRSSYRNDRNSTKLKF